MENLPSLEAIYFQNVLCEQILMMDRCHHQLRLILGMNIKWTTGIITVGPVLLTKNGPYCMELSFHIFHVPGVNRLSAGRG